MHGRGPARIVLIIKAAPLSHSLDRSLSCLRAYINHFSESRILVADYKMCIVLSLYRIYQSNWARFEYVERG